MNFDYDRRQGKPIRGKRFINKEGEFLKNGPGEKGETSGFNQKEGCFDQTRKKFNLKLTRLEESRIINSKENNSVKKENNAVPIRGNKSDKSDDGSSR